MPAKAAKELHFSRTPIAKLFVWIDVEYYLFVEKGLLPQFMDESAALRCEFSQTKGDIELKGKKS